MGICRKIIDQEIKDLAEAMADTGIFMSLELNEEEVVTFYKKVASVFENMASNTEKINNGKR